MQSFVDCTESLVFASKKKKKKKKKKKNRGFQEFMVGLSPILVLLK